MSLQFKVKFLPELAVQGLKQSLPLLPNLWILVLQTKIDGFNKPFVQDLVWLLLFEDFGLLLELVKQLQARRNHV